jgi:hypothetical protein
LSALCFCTFLNALSIPEALSMASS